MDEKEMSKYSINTHNSDRNIYNTINIIYEAYCTTEVAIPNGNWRQHRNKKGIKIKLIPL
jgi:hypothetical protein